MLANMIQRSDEWHEFRKNHVGSSDIAAIVGLDPYHTAHDVWLEKTGCKVANSTNPAMQWGIDNEPNARDAFIKEIGEMVEPSVLEGKEHTWMGASLDGITFDGTMIVEIKCPLSYESVLKAQRGEIQKKYVAQIQWQLMVSGAEVAYLYLWHPNGTFLKEIPADPVFQAMLLDAGKKFWDLVTNNIEPSEPKKYLELTDDEFIFASETWKVANQKRKEAEEKEAEARKTLLDCTDGLATIGNGIKIDYVEPEATVDWQKAFEELETVSGVKREAINISKFRKVRASYPKISVLKK